jgi:hypothetical protein
MTAMRSLRRTGKALAGSARVFLSDVGHGLLEVSHNTLALLGLVVLAATLFLAGRPDLRHDAEGKVLGWLKARAEARLDRDLESGLVSALAEPDAIARATAADPAELNRQQALVASWLARRYRVAPEPVARLVQEAWDVGQRARLEPTLILAIMAIESGFNPFAQSPVGAQGLMQVMTRVHDDKYEFFGGNHAAFDPITNLKVGVQVLRECIARAGSLEGGLKFYVGAANLEDDGGYAAKVLAEQRYLAQVARGQQVSLLARLPTPSAPAAAGNAAAAEATPEAPAPAASREREQVALLVPRP